MLLRSYDHSRSHETHKSNDLVGSKAVAVNEISPNETACSAESSFAVYRNSLVLDINSLMSKLDKLSDEW